MSNTDRELVEALVARLRGRLALVIFDCDGVLVDSEAISREVIISECRRLGLAMDDAWARRFTGLRWSDLQPVLEAEAGQTLPADWPMRMQDGLIAAMAGRLQAMPGAAEAMRAVAGLGLPYRIASNSSHAEMAAKFADTGLTQLTQGRCHSAKDVGVGKPAPDLFLAVAKAAGVAPGACLVVEDSVPGVTAARAAGMACLAYAPHGGDAPLLAQGAVPIRSLGEVARVAGQCMAREEVVG